MISVIIPIYNASLFLNECILSILNQTCNDYEVICVDDGSTDNSLEICKEYEKIDSRFHVLSQSNCGVSAARNAGIRMAKGDFVCFLDADDMFSLDYLSFISNVAEPRYAVACQFTMDKDSLGRGGREVLLEGKQTLIDNILENNKYHLHLGSFLFDLNVLKQHNILFTNGCVRNEDIEFICKYICHCNKAKVIAFNAYFYRQHAKSVMHNLKMQHLTSIEAEERLVNYIENNGLAVDKERLLAMIIFKLTVLAAREHNKKIYEYLHVKYNIPNIVGILSKSNVKIMYKLLAFTYSFLGERLFFRLL